MPAFIVGKCLLMTSSQIAYFSHAVVGSLAIEPPKVGSLTTIGSSSSVQILPVQPGWVDTNDHVRSSLIQIMHVVDTLSLSVMFVSAGGLQTNRKEVLCRGLQRQAEGHGPGLG